MNRQAEFEAMINESSHFPQILETTFDRALKKRSRRRVWFVLTFFTMVLCFILTVPQLKADTSINNPLVVIAHAVDVDGANYMTALTLGEKIPLAPAVFPHENFKECYAFDLSLVDGVYLQLSSVDQNWNLVLDKEIHSSEDVSNFPYWALVEGSEISVISTDLSGNVLQGYKDGSLLPRMKGNSMIWRPNNAGVNRCIIDCYDTQFIHLRSYYIEITKADNVYYAEVVKIA